MPSWIIAVFNPAYGYYEKEDGDENGGAPSPSPSGRGKRNPRRYRWPDDFRDEVLARLLEMNKQRAEEERLSGVATEGADRTTGKKAAKKAAAKPRQTRRARDTAGDEPKLFE